LYRFSFALAQLCRSPHELLYSVKRTLRVLKKTLRDRPADLRRNEFRHLLDIYRTGVVFDTLQQMQTALDILKDLAPNSTNRDSALRRLKVSSDINFEVVRVKNRFAKAAVNGYMDVLVSLRIDGYVMELQLHLKRILDFKGETGRRTAKWAQLYLESADRYVGKRTPDGRRTGNGAQFFASGERYAGNFTSDKRDGIGSYFHANGARYDGDYEDDRMHGRGAYFFASGEHYVGDFFQDKMHGKGAYFFEDGSRYEGDYNSGKRHGKGLLVFVSGDRYEGEFHDDEMHGKGTYYCNDQRVELGCYVKGQDRGPGVRWSADRRQAWRLQDGENSGRISLEEANKLALELGFDEAPPVDNRGC